jgi:hypothetical protein
MQLAEHSPTPATVEERGTRVAKTRNIRSGSTQLSNALELIRHKRRSRLALNLQLALVLLILLGRGHNLPEIRVSDMKKPLTMTAR